MIGEREVHSVRGERGHSSPRGERGIALLISLLVMVLLTVIVVEFTFATQVDYRRAAMWVAARRAALVADGGVMLASEVLHQDALIGSTDTLRDIWARELPPFDTGAGMLSVRIEDEQAKINLNTLASGSLSPAGRQFQMLCNQLNLDPALALPLADWLDKNQDPGPGGLAAESEWYANAAPPYAPRNGMMRSYAELALIRGFTPPVLAKLRRFTTVLPEFGLKVNVNTAPPEILRVMDARLDDERLVKAIVDARTANPFTKMASLAAIPGMQVFTEQELDQLFGVSSLWFRIRATADVNGAMRSAEALVKRENGNPKIVYLLPRRGPNIVGLDSGIRARLDEPGFLAGTR